MEHSHSAVHGGSTHKPTETRAAATRQLTSKSLGSSAAGVGTASNRRENKEMERDSKQERSTCIAASPAGGSIGPSSISQTSKSANSTVASTGSEGVSINGDIVSTTAQSKDSGCGPVATATNTGDESVGSTDPKQWTRYLFSYLFKTPIVVHDW